jgi:hypothetical protein
VAAGTVQAVLICVPVASGDSASGIDQQVCPQANGQYFHLQSQQAYVLAPDSAGYIDSIAQPFDYGTAVGFWSFAFGTVLSLWLVAYGVGSVINVIRRNLY